MHGFSACTVMGGKHCSSKQDVVGSTIDLGHLLNSQDRLLHLCRVHQLLAQVLAAGIVHWDSYHQLEALGGALH